MEIYIIQILSFIPINRTKLVLVYHIHYFDLHKTFDWKQYCASVLKLFSFLFYAHFSTGLVLVVIFVPLGPPPFRLRDNKWWNN